MKGTKVFVTHFRRFDGVSWYMTRWDGKIEGLGSPLPTGGATEATIVNHKGEFLASAVASCSDKDAFNKKIGRDIAIGRAYKQLEREHAGSASS